MFLRVEAPSALQIERNRRRAIGRDVLAGLRSKDGTAVLREGAAADMHSTLGPNYCWNAF